MSASSQCPHAELDFDINIVNFDDSNVKFIELKAKCTVCDTAMLFLGCPLGVSFAQPTASARGEEIRLPMCGEGEEPQIKSGIVGAVLKT